MNLRITLLLCIILTFFPAVLSETLQAQTKRALLIGIDLYAPPDNFSSTTLRKNWSNLDGCTNDALVLKEILISRFGFQEQNITILLDSIKSSKRIATKEKIIAAIKEKLIQPSKEGDIAFFYYAGHGSQIKNSKSPEKDKLDETLVPSDSYLSTTKDIRDIRDKELAVLFNELVDKKIISTLIFDSCHSGSIARGKEDNYKERKLEPIDIDVADAKIYPSPEERKGGPLVISAAQDYQTAKETTDENGNPHGAFTDAFIRALRNSSVNESVESIFARLQAIVQSTGRDQHPVLAGPPERRKQTLFGIDADKLQNKTVAAILKKEDAEIILQGGLAVGLRPGTELEKIRTSENSSVARIKVTEVSGLNKSYVTIIEGKSDDVNIGDLFEVTKWVIPEDLSLKIYVPKTDYNFDALKEIAQNLYLLQNEKNITISSEPVDNNITHEIYFSHSEWKLRDVKNGNIQNLGLLPDIQKIKSILADKTVILFINMPPSLEAYDQIKTKFGIKNSLVSLTEQKESKYTLAGRNNNGIYEYALYLPELVNGNNNLSLPLITDWVDLSTTESIPKGIEKINELAFMLGKINAWLTLEVPADENSFPYKLALKNSETGVLKPEGEVIEGEIYGLTLVLDSLLLKNWDKNKRWIYVLSIDSHGEINSLFPTSGNVENQEPSNISPTPTEIRLGSKRLFRIGAPFGIDTYLLLTSPDQIPNISMIESKGVKTRGATRGNPLTDLLSNVGAATRGSNPIMPVDWSLQRITIKSVSK